MRKYSVLSRASVNVLYVWVVILGYFSSFIALGPITSLMKLWSALKQYGFWDSDPTDVVWLLLKAISLITLFIIPSKNSNYALLFSTVLWMMGYDSFRVFCSFQKKKKKMLWIITLLVCTYVSFRIENTMSGVTWDLRVILTSKKQLIISIKDGVTHQIFPRTIS